MSRAVGIDLGTTYSAVAVLQDDGMPVILPNSEGSNITPSVVLFPASDMGEEPLVGEMAKHSAATAPLDVVQFVKRQMGNPDWKFETTNGSSFTAEEVSAVILKRLAADAELALGEPVRDVVITVPAYFDDARRTATKHAGRIAGLNVLRVLNEPTAAAMSYGLDVEEAGTVLVYDLGGGTFDVTAMHIEDGTFTVLATDGNRNLGGFDFDNRIAERVFQEIEAQGIKDAYDLPEVVAEVREKAELAKRSLTTVAQATIIMTVRGKQVRLKLTRDEFEDMCQDLLNQTRELTEDVMDQAGLAWRDIDHLLLIGGSTRMPMVRTMMKELSGIDPERDVNPDEAVALGAAIQAAMAQVEQGDSHAPDASGASVQGTALGLPMTSNGQGIVVSDVTSQSLGVILLDSTTREEYNEVVIPRNSTIPTKAQTQVATVVDRQSRFLVRVTEGEDRDPAYVTVIGSKELTIPGTYPKGAPFTVSYAYDIDQTVFVEVFDNTADKLVGTFEVDRLQNLSEDEVVTAMRRMEQVHLD